MAVGPVTEVNPGGCVLRGRDSARDSHPESSHPHVVERGKVAVAAAHYARAGGIVATAAGSETGVVFLAANGEVRNGCSYCLYLAPALLIGASNSRL